MSDSWTCGNNFQSVFEHGRRIESGLWCRMECTTKWNGKRTNSSGRVPGIKCIFRNEPSHEFPLIFSTTLIPVSVLRKPIMRSFQIGCIVFCLWMPCLTSLRKLIPVRKAASDFNCLTLHFKKISYCYWKAFCWSTIFLLIKELTKVWWLFGNWIIYVINLDTSFPMRNTTQNFLLSVKPSWVIRWGSLFALAGSFVLDSRITNHTF